MTVLIKVLLSFIAIIVLLTVISFWVTASKNNLSIDQLCLHSNCIINFKKIFSGTFEILGFGISAIWIFVLVSGVYIALKNYLTSVKSTALSSHISHLTMFKDYIEEEISKLDTLKSKRINIFVWYSLAFPNSRDGDIEVSTAYSSAIDKICDAVEHTNDSINSPKGEYGYRKHQERLISTVSSLGIKLSFLPKNDFHNVENDLFLLIDSVNQTFSNSTQKLSNIKRDYL